ncbi:MAG TPA: HIT domain-containing protein, partial [Gemmatimonadaceae bacterium]|nr:HIT domain-containing protein [Gemmatimonadaceae bacterium]
MPEHCLFCRIVSGEVPATIVATSERCIAFRDIGPQAPTHVLVIPRAHIPSLNDLTDHSLAADMIALGAQVATAEGIAGPGYRLVINTNAHGGQTV